jgi:hypothetical protein
MGYFDLKKIAVGMFASLVIVLAGTDASAQSRRDIERERQRIQRQNERYDRTRQRTYRNDGLNSGSGRRTEQRTTNTNYAAGYDQGFQAGQMDRRKGKYNRSNVYRDTGAYPNEGDPTSNDYVYRRGYLQGYNDGFNGIRNY